MATSQKMYCQDQQIINMLDLNIHVLEQWLNEQIPNMIIECSQGSQIPLNILIHGEFLLLEGLPPYALKVQKTCYLKMGNKEPLFSSDLKEWKDFQNFFTGSINIQLTDQSEVHLNVELNQRVFD